MGLKYFVSADFCKEEFKNGFTIDVLCKAIKNDGLNIKECTIEALNKLLKNTNLYETLEKGKPISDRLKQCIFEYKTNKFNIKKLNRIVIEEFYPQLTPEKKCFDRKNWIDITREERLFCAHLYFDIIKNGEKNFVSWLNNKMTDPKLRLNPDDNWEVGYEVCFYRDYLYFMGDPVKKSDFFDKRTFDLCLFSDKNIVIIEAKAQQGFHGNQLADFGNDRKLMAKLLPDIGLTIVALISSRYSPKAPFDAKFTWKEISDHYAINKAIYERADDLYGN
jgi:hypothetical protein